VAPAAVHVSRTLFRPSADTAQAAGEETRTSYSGCAAACTPAVSAGCTGVHKNAKRGDSRLPATGANGPGYAESRIGRPPPDFNGKEGSGVHGSTARVRTGLRRGHLVASCCKREEGHLQASPASCNSQQLLGRDFNPLGTCERRRASFGALAYVWPTVWPGGRANPMVDPKLARLENRYRR